MEDFDRLFDVDRLVERNDSRYINGGSVEDWDEPEDEDDEPKNAGEEPDWDKMPGGYDYLYN